MNQRFNVIFRHRYQYSSVWLKWLAYLCASLLFHALAFILFLVARNAKIETGEANVMWIASTHLDNAGVAGGSMSVGVGEQNKDAERQRRVSEGSRKVNVVSKIDRSMREHPVSDVGIKLGSKEVDTGAARVHKSESLSKTLVGTAGVGMGGGVGVGTSVRGLKAFSDTRGISGLVSDLDSDFPFVWYLQQVQARVTSNWNRLSLTHGRVQIYFRIMRGGAVNGVRVESPSGNTSFDQAALLAVLRSGPLPKLPDGFDADFLGVKFWFTSLDN